MPLIILECQIYIKDKIYDKVEKALILSEIQVFLKLKNFF